MSDISTKLTYLNETKNLLKTQINNGLPSEQQITSSTTFREYVTSIFNAFLEALRTPDTLFTNLPKKSGTGANITLNDTANAPMRITLGSRALEQKTTTGANIYYMNYIDNTSTFHGTTIKMTTTGYSISGTGDSTSTAYTLINRYITLPAGTYTMKTKKQNTIVVGLSKRDYSSVVRISTGASSNTFTLNEATDVCLTLVVASGGNYNETNEVMIYSGTDTKNFEEYTGGIPAPNPSYPQDIHTISGSNTISVCGKQLLEITPDNFTVRCSYVSGANTNEYKLLCSGSDMYINDLQSIGVSYNKARNGNLIPCNYGETIYFDTGNSLFNNLYFNEFDENLISLGYGSKSTSSGTYTSTKANCKYVTVRFGYPYSVSGTTYTLAPIFSNSPITGYTPYTLETKDIDLKSKNLFDNTKILTNKTFTSTDTINDSTGLFVSDYIKVKPSTDYYVNEYASVVLGLDKDKTSLGYIRNTSSAGTFTTGSTCEYVRIRSHSTTIPMSTAIANAMLNEGTKALDYEPYYDYGECGSIGNYENIPIRTFGKNWFDISTISESKYLGWNGEEISTANSNSSDYIEVKANQKFTLSWNYTEPLNSSSQREIVLYNKNKQFVETITLVPMTNKTQTFTISQNGYIRFDYDKKCYDIMLNEGTTASTYEPYGNGTWYLKQEIGKVVLDGSENWALHGSIPSWFYVDNFIDGIIDNSVTYSMYSNYYIQENYNNVGNLTNGQFAYTPTGNKRLVFKNTSCSTVSDFKTWLSTHNTDLYYVLATPTYTQITGTLAEQLENVYQKMLSQKGQTNISQVNDDLSFNLSVSAIEEL